MRLRTPVELESIDEKIPSLEEYRAEYQVKVITPIYGGGVNAGQPDEAMPIRASAIRGQLRYWWRFLQSHGDKKLTGENLYHKEREIWGGIGDENEKKDQQDFSSKIFVKTTHGTDRQIEPCCEYLPTTNARGYKTYNLEFLHDIPQYAMFPGQGKSPSANDYNDSEDCPHKVILPEFEFKLIISATKEKISDDDWKTIHATIRWWASFGGIGARTRRGLGSIEIAVLSPLTDDEVQSYGCVLKQINSRNPMKAWNTAIDKLQQFRQGVNTGRNQKMDDNGKLATYGNNVPAQGGSRWPEPDSIREITGHHSNRHTPRHPARIAFPRAVFGLPIIFKFNNQDEQAGDPQQSELRPTHSERMASPLILKAMASGNGKYKAIALKLPSTHLNTLVLQLNGIDNQPNQLTPEKQQEWTDKHWQQWPDHWWEDSKANDVKPISTHKGSDALTAFMNYFGGR